MNKEQYERLCELFTRSSELPRHQRRAFLDAHCEGENELRSELIRMWEQDDSSLMELNDDSDDGSFGERMDSEIRPTLPGYRIQELLGEGGMGTVWRAYHEGTSRDVAVKIVDSSRLRSPKARARFEREVHLCAGLNDSSIAKIYDSGVTSGFAYYTMELIEGIPIDGWASRHKLNQRNRVELMRDVCRAIEHAHQKGVIHRDLKPSNLLVSDEGRPYVVDFGLAKGCLEDSNDNAVSLTGEILGTPAYMSPEQASGETSQLDTRSDVYSLGVIFYHLITGEMPHDTSDSTHRVIHRIASEEIRLPREFDRSIDRDLEAILLKALARHKDDRYGSAGEMATDVDRYLQGLPISARSPSLGYFVSKWIRSHVLLATAVSVLVVCALLGSSAFLLMMQRHTEEARGMARAADLQRQAANDAKERSEQLSYTLGIQLAADEIATYRFRRGLSFLDSLPAHQRGWEWDYLHNLVKPNDNSTWKTEGLSPELRSICLSPDGQWLAATMAKSTIEQTEDPRIVIVDAKTGEVVRYLEGHTDGVFAVTFTPDSQQLISGGRDKSLCRWEVATGKLIEKMSPTVNSRDVTVELFPFAIALSERYAAVSVHPAGLLINQREADEGPWTLADIFSNAAQVVNLPGERGEIVIDDAHQRLVWSTIVWEENVGHLYAVDLDKMERIAHFQQPPGHPFTSVDVSPDGNRVVTACFDGAAQVWDFKSLKLLQELRGHEGALNDARFLGDGDRLVTIARDEVIRIWDLTRSKTIDVLYPSDSAVGHSLVVDAKQSVVYSVHNPGVVVRRWDVELDGSPARVIAEHAGKVRDSTVRPQGDLVVSAGEDSRVQVRDLRTGKLVWENTEGNQYATAVAFTPDGKTLVVGRSRNPNVSQPPIGELRFFDALTGKPDRPAIAIEQWIWDLEYDPTGRLLAIGTGVPGGASEERLGQALVIDASSGEVLTRVKTLGRRCRGVAFDPQQRTLLTASESELAVWDLKTSELVASDVAVEGRNFVKLHGEWVVTGNRNAVEFRTLPTLERVRLFEQDQYSHERFGLANVADASFTPTGDRMVTGAWNKTLTIWNCRTGRAVYTFPAHEAGVHHVTFTTDGNTVVSSGHDGTVRRWQRGSDHDGRSVRDE